MTTTEYKGYTIETKENNGNAYIYRLGVLIGVSHSDCGKENQVEKAKQRIDSGTVNSMSAIRESLKK